MKFGLRYCNTGPYTDPAKAVALLQAAEEAGFESAWTVEHVVVPRDYRSAYPYSPDGRMPGREPAFSIPDPLIWMAYVAATTTRIRLATGILILPEHNPVLCAKQVATLDHLSRGRVILGIGVGWLREEFDALGVPFAQRGRRTEEYVAAMRALWEQDEPRFAGEFVRFDGAYMRPKPHAGTVPIVIGGHSEAAARRAGRIADGFFPARGAPPELLAALHDSARAAGRDPAAIELTVSMPEDLDTLPTLAAQGVGRVLVPVMANTGVTRPIRDPEDLAAWRDIIARHSG
ncbi:MAG: LLM class F420-dependent oxidoreductase [Rhodospirillales bacterium]|nr:LLM class F420-dependent oxidoreductase [Rhodospirillales bacterium]